MKNQIFLILALLSLSASYAQDLVITNQQDTISCKVIGRPQGKVVISFMSDGITIDSALDASTVQQVIFDVSTREKAMVPMRVTSEGDTILGKLIFQNDSMHYFRHNGVTQAVPKRLLTSEEKTIGLADASNPGSASKYSLKSKKQNQQQAYLGYQIGGISLVGFDMVIGYPVGIHAGIGFAGYTFGLRYYPIPTNSFHLNMSFKDGGFGLMNTVGLELGGNIVPFSSRGGLHVQAGLGIITNIDPAFSEELFGANEEPQAILSLGIGFKLF